jgi:hypothetical protein
MRIILALLSILVHVCGARAQSVPKQVLGFYYGWYGNDRHRNAGI